MKKLRKIIPILTFATASIVITQSCDKTEDPINDTQNTVKIIENSIFGKILTDSEGMSLYFNSKDVKGNSLCIDGCLANWPLFFKENISVDEALDKNDFGTITRDDGNKQTTYKGWPLYYYTGDANSGDINGDKVLNIWYVAKPDYSLMYVSAQLTGYDGLNYTSNYTAGNEESFYITDIEGNTLYLFSNDTYNNNTFTADDFSNNTIWAIAEINLDKVPSIFSATNFGTIDVFGKTQLTYKGWPLYYFGQDIIRGDNKGVSFPSPGVWPIINTETNIAQ